MKNTLSPRQARILSLLAQGESYTSICNLILDRKKRPISPANLHTTCDHIRRKTGIHSTRSPQECRDYLQGARQTFRTTPEKGPTRTQQHVIEMLAEGKTLEEIARQLTMSVNTAKNHASQGCKRLGVVHSGWDRVEQLKVKLAEGEEASTPPPERAPLVDLGFNDPAFL